MKLSKMTKLDRPSEVNKIPNVGKGGDGLDNFIEQMQKNKSDSEESDIEAEEVTDGFEGEEMGRITGIFNRNIWWHERFKEWNEKDNFRK